MAIDPGTHPDGIPVRTRPPLTARQRIWVLVFIVLAVAAVASLWGSQGQHRRPETTADRNISAGMPYSPPVESKPVAVPAPMPMVAPALPHPLRQAALTDDKALEAPIFASGTGEGGERAGARATRADDEEKTRDDEFSQTMRASDVGAPSRAKKMRHPALTIPAGIVIPCILQTAINSELMGFVDCILPADVRSADGTVVLLDKGTQVMGQIRSGLRRGQERLFILWTRARTPENVTVDLASPAADELGGAGVEGAVNDHFWKQFLTAALYSLIEYGPQLGTAAIQNAGKGNSAVNNYTTFLQPQQQLANTMLQDDLHIPPTLEKNQGDIVSIFVARDLLFDSVYALRIKSAP